MYGEAIIDESNVRRWVKKFKEDETSAEDKPRSGMPSTTATEKHQNRVEEMIRANRRITVRKMMNFTKVTVLLIR